ncbi:MAG: hypothetical protein LBT68_06295 [Spirochaetales bacterium]|jgi:hypothetical protein|nr:hypothetical protein [Spirochaetales bacterium]
MKVLLVADREELKLFLEKELALRGARLVHYWHPIKAMDNVDEMAPEMIIFSARDFPRHWKPFLVYFRAHSPEAAKIPFVLLRGESFSDDEVKKAEYLGVSDVLPEALDNPADLQTLKKYIVSSQNPSYRPAASEKADILFSHPQSLVLVQGRVREISADELSFSPLSPELCEDIEPPAVLQSCSLSIFDVLIAVDIEITQKNAEGFQARFLSGGEEIAPYI